MVVVFLFYCYGLDHVPVVMGAIWWGTRGTCPPTFPDGAGHNMPCPPTFFSLGFVFGEVSKIKVVFVTFYLKGFSCKVVHLT